MSMRLLFGALLALACFSCGDDKADQYDDLGTGGVVDQASPVCDVADGGGNSVVAAPVLVASLSDSWHEGWLGSPSVVDLDGDGTLEIFAPRGNLLLGWHLDGEIVFRQETGDGRIWASPVVADLLPSSPGLEIAVASRDRVFAFNAAGEQLSGFPFTGHDELRSLAAGDIDGDGHLDLVTATTSRLEGNGQRDIIYAVHSNGKPFDNFPPNISGASGCDEWCSVTGGFDQNVGLGDVDGDGVLDIFVGHDNSHASLHRGSGEAFEAASIFKRPTKFNGIRFLHDYTLAQEGWAEDEESANQAHFTNSAPAITDIDGDGNGEIVVLASVQNAAQTDRYRGVALWVLRNDGTRPENWTTPYHVSDYLAGLWDFEGVNVVAATNQVTVADITSHSAGPELLFAGFDGRIHCVGADAHQIWTFTYTDDDQVLTGGVVVADLSGDGKPETIFSSYSPDEDKSAIFILDDQGNQLHRIPLPGRGSMAVPTIADAQGNGTLEILVNLKESQEGQPQVLVYEVPGSTENCMLWPTGRGNLLRNGYVP